VVILEGRKPGISKLFLAKTIHTATSKSIEDATPPKPENLVIPDDN
jgi:hypothetical protein